MLAGTTYPVTINVSVVSLSAFERDWAGECRREYMACAKALAGSSPVTDPLTGFSNLWSIVVASTERLRRMQEELHVICGFPVRVRVTPSRVR
jgi:hypothetical protein